MDDSKVYTKALNLAIEPRQLHHKRTAMHISVTKKHIKATQLSQNNLTPVEIAVMELDCFEDVRLLTLEGQQYMLDLDGMQVVMTNAVYSALAQFEEDGSMRPLEFDLPVGDSTEFVEDDFMMESFEEPLDLGGYGFGYA